MGCQRAMRSAFACSSAAPRLLPVRRASCGSQGLVRSHAQGSQIPPVAGTCEKASGLCPAKHGAQPLVVETALALLLSLGGADRLETALACRLDRMEPADRALERHTSIRTRRRRFVRFRLTSMPPLPDTAQAYQEQSKTGSSRPVEGWGGETQKSFGFGLIWVTSIACTTPRGNLCLPSRVL